MGTTTSTPLTSLILYASLTTSVAAPLPEETSLTCSTTEVYAFDQSIAERNDNAFSAMPDYSIDLETNKINTLLSFANQIIENSEDIENKYIDFVNENFWDLV